MPEIDASPTLNRRTVVTYPTYQQAQRAVDYLSDNRFPVERVSIVAEGLRLVENVTGRKNYGRAALYGAASGAVVGAFFGFFFGMWNWIAPMISAVSLMFFGLMYGALVGAIIGVVGHALTRGQRDFSSVTGLDATRYSVMVDDEVADEAARMLERFGPRPPETPQAEKPAWDTRSDTIIPAH